MIKQSEQDLYDRAMGSADMYLYRNAPETRINEQLDPPEGGDAEAGE